MRWQYLQDIVACNWRAIVADGALIAADGDTAGVNLIVVQNIQVLRAFAAVNVVLFHSIGIALSMSGQELVLEPLAGWGASGVDIFFVISGFIMARTQIGRPWHEFLLNRFLRVAPLYWLLTFVTLSTALAAPFLFQDLEVSYGYVAASLGFFSMAAGFDYPLLSVGWTLEYEMLFYVLFATGIGLLSGRLTLIFPVVMLIILALVGIVDWIIAEFCFGIGCYLLFERLRETPERQWMALHFAGWALLIASVFWRPDVHRAILWGIPAALIVLSSTLIPQIKNRLLLALGDASYSIYLTHLFVVSAVFLLLGGVQGDLAIVLSVGAAIGGGWLTWFAVERPMADKIKVWRRGRQFSSNVIAASSAR